MAEEMRARPRVADGLSFLYVERCRVEQDQRAVVLIDEHGRTPVPSAALLLLMLGPGVSITHAAVRNLGDCGCAIAWVGEQGVRFYATGLGANRSARNLLRQARLAMHAPSRMRVVRRMYELRFGESIDESLSLRQVRGREGARVRDAYARESERTGVEWFGRSYRRDDWRAADPVNRAISAGNACLYGIVHAAIAVTGYSPAIGFVHSGRQLSFVHDIADLYKTEISVPAAFAVVACGDADPETAVRRSIRDTIRDSHLLDRIVRDIDTCLGSDGVPHDMISEDDPVGFLWDPEGPVPDGINYVDEEDAA